MSNVNPSEPRRPRLLPQNRKLRHLKGVYLRNLSFAPVSHQQTVDDTELGNDSNKTSIKLEALNELGPLQHSRSSNDLERESQPCRENEPCLWSRQPQRKASLSLGPLSSSRAREQHLKDLLDAAVADVFFSLHVNGQEDPVYISEMRPRSTNFNFQFFELDKKPSLVSRSCIFTIRIWARRPKQESWIFLLEEVVDLRRLNFIGSLLNRKFPPNALVIHLEDGVYSLDFPNRIAEPRHGPQVATTSSYNSLMKLANLEASIEDALETRLRISQEIGRILENIPPDHSPVRREQAKQVAQSVVAQQRENGQAEQRREQLRESIQYRREAVARGRAAQAKAAQDIANNQEKLEASKLLAEETAQQINGQRRRICLELFHIFPITPIPNSPPLSFEICGIPLPNSKYDATTLKTINEDVLSAGLGLVALLTQHLHFYLSHHLPYSLHPFGSRSYARDDISHFTTTRAAAAASKSCMSRDFPLYLPRGGSTAGQWRFEYAWFLLNKDIESLCASQGLRVVDIQHTLPNLKYLLYVCSAGSEEVPERKKGGVRGLWAGKVKGRGGVGDHERVGGFDGGGETGSIEDGVDDVELPFAEERFTLRTKGLREDVSR